MRTIAVLFLSAAMLTACGKPEAGKDAAAPAAAPAVAPANVEIKGPAAGKWRIITTMNGREMPPSEVCFKKQMTMAEAQSMQKDSGVTCSENSYRRDGANVIGHSVCQNGATKMTSDVIVTGDMNTAYSMQTAITMEPAPAPNMGTMKMAAKLERLGDCDPEK